MTVAVAESPVGFVDTELTKAIVNALDSAFSMCDRSAKCVGISSVPTSESGMITGMIGVHGKVSGFVTVNMSDRVAIKAVEGLLHESFTEINSQVVDGAGEITNIIVGGIKSALGGTKWAFSNMTVPSVIIGRGYQIAYARGLEFLCATFEHDDDDAVMLEDRLVQVSISLLQL